MTCPDCTAASEGLWHGYQSSCLECSARQLSEGLGFFYSSRDKQFTPAYRAALQSTFGDGWAAGHERVKWFAARKHKTREQS